MAISRFSTSSVAQGLPKYQKLWDGTSVVLNTAYESIQTITVGGTSLSSIEFTSIPSTYKHLQIRYIARDNRASTGADDMFMTFNSGASATYSWRRLVAEGANPTSAGSGNESYISISAAAISRGNNSSNIFSAGVIDILDYTNTNKTKTSREFYGLDTNGGGGIAFSSGNWYGSTNAITSIKFTAEASSSFVQYTQFALYGIK